MPSQTRHQARLPTGQPLHQPISNDRRQRQREASGSPYVHPFSLGMQIVYDSDDETDGDVSSLDLDHGLDEAEDTDDDEDGNDSIIVIGNDDYADSEYSEPAAEIRLEEEDDVDDEMGVYGCAEVDEGSAISEDSYGGLHDADDTISDRSLDDREIPGPIQQHASSKLAARDEPLSSSSSSSSSPSSSPSPAPRPASAAAPAFNENPSHFERVYRGRTTIWSHVDWARYGPAVLARECRQGENEKRWKREGGKSRAARKQAWRRGDGWRDRDERGRFV